MRSELTLTIRPVSPVSGAILHVYIEDTTYIDAPARVLWHGTYPVAPAADGDQVVKLPAQVFSENIRCTLRVHLTFNKSETISAGDYITTESYSLAENLTVRLHRVP